MMDQFDDWAEVAKTVEGELSRVVARFKWWPSKGGQSYGQEIWIDIFETPAGHYFGMPDRAVKTPAQASSYFSMDTQDTPRAALEDVIRGHQMFMGDPAETEFPLIDEADQRESVRKIVQEELRSGSKGGSKK